MDLRIGQVSLDCPRLQVPVQPRTDVVQSEIQLLIRRVGEPADFASYLPISTIGNVLVFQFDSLLFDGLYGRYAGTLVFNGTPYLSLEFEYTTATSINPALQLSTVGPYRKPREYGSPDWSGTGVAGPGTFIGLKDCPKTYAGASGKLLSVRTLENGIEFVGLVAGDNISVAVAEGNIVISATGPEASGVDSVVAGANISVNDTDPSNPIISGPPIYQATMVPAAPSQNGVLMVYLGQLAGNPSTGGAAYSLNGGWIDLFSGGAVPVGT